MAKGWECHQPVLNEGWLAQVLVVEQINLVIGDLVLDLQPV
jgi:hypothetical protein